MFKFLCRTSLTRLDMYSLQNVTSLRALASLTNLRALDIGCPSENFHVERYISSERTMLSHTRTRTGTSLPRSLTFVREVRVMKMNQHMWVWAHVRVYMRVYIRAHVLVYVRMRVRVNNQKLSNWPTTYLRRFLLFFSFVCEFTIFIHLLISILSEEMHDVFAAVSESLRVLSLGSCDSIDTRMTSIESLINLETLHLVCVYMCMVLKLHDDSCVHVFVCARGYESTWW